MDTSNITKLATDLANEAARLAEKAAGLVNQSLDLAQQQATLQAAQTGGGAMSRKCRRDWGRHGISHCY